MESNGKPTLVRNLHTTKNDDKRSSAALCNNNVNFALIPTEINIQLQKYLVVLFKYRSVY